MGKNGAKLVTRCASVSKGPVNSWKFLFALVLFLILPASVLGASTSLAWGITVYVKADTAGMRSVSAAQGTYIYEGTITYARLDTSLGTALNGLTTSVTPNGCTSAFTLTKAYPSAPIDNSIYNQNNGCYSDYTAKKSGCSISPETCKVDPPGPYPIVTPDINRLTATSKNSISWTVQYGTPDIMTKTTSPDFTATDTTKTWVVGVQKVSVTVANAQDLHNFPVDTQTLYFGLTNSALPEGAMKFKFIDDEKSFITSTAGNPDNDAYIILDSSYEITTDDVGNSGFRLKYTVKRNPDLYFIRFILPLTIITAVVLGWMFAPPGNGSRTNGPFTIIATTTSFIFIASNSVPQIPYRTRLDNYFIFQFLLASIVGIWNIYSANRMDRFKGTYQKKFADDLKAREEKKKQKEAELELAKQVLSVTGDPSAAGESHVSLKISEPEPVKHDDNEPKDETAKQVYLLLKYHKTNDAKAAEKAAASSKAETALMEGHYMRDIYVACAFVVTYVILVACLFAA